MFGVVRESGWAGQTHKQEWIDVAIERMIDPEDDSEAWREEAHDEAEDAADAEFKKAPCLATLT